MEKLKAFLDLLVKYPFFIIGAMARVDELQK